MKVFFSIETVEGGSKFYKGSTIFNESRNEGIFLNRDCRGREGGRSFARAVRFWELKGDDEKVTIILPI